METLYDLLKALPDDDADSLRAAFRETVKLDHPDNSPDDSDAPRRFKPILRANAILRDERQRATYDQLLDIAARQQGSTPKRAIVLDRIRRRAFYVTIGAAVVVATVCCCLAFGYLSNLRVPIHIVEPSARESTQSVDIISTTPSDELGRAGPREILKDIGTSDRPANAKPFEERPIADTPPLDSAPSTVDAPMARDFGVSDARYYRERGISAYRSGDLYLALVDFNLAISLDPNFSDAFIDRGVVYYRLGDRERAFADVAEAKRIDDSNRSGTALTAATR